MDLHKHTKCKTKNRELVRS